MTPAILALSLCALSSRPVFVERRRACQPTVLAMRRATDLLADQPRQDFRVLFLGNYKGLYLALTELLASHHFFALGISEKDAASNGYVIGNYWALPFPDKTFAIVQNMTVFKEHSFSTFSHGPISALLRDLARQVYAVLVPEGYFITPVPYDFARILKREGFIKQPFRVSDNPVFMKETTQRLEKRGRRQVLEAA